jgi:Ni2+-binding GTPase involved in maturation of urease and hydrogenase
MTAPSRTSSKARYIMIGGFLGAGKTTAVGALAQRLTDAGLRVGLITNDQGSELVDTATLRARGFAAEEIPGGCFCCRFNSLVEASERLKGQSHPDVFIAEPVGSCTDLVATVSYPLRRMYGDQFTVAPFSVLVDPVRAERVFGLAEGKKFSEKVVYIYRKQLEEADLIVITKNETVEPARIAALKQRLAHEFPQARVLDVSVRLGTGVPEWFDEVESGVPGSRSAMEIDYQTYAEGEALLGWLNATAQLTGTAPFEANQALELLAAGIQHRLPGVEIAHLKMTFSPDDGLGDIAVINLVRSDLVPELSVRLEAPAQAGQLIINLRGEGPPIELELAVRGALETFATALPGVTARLEHLESFRPGKPEPTHRLLSLIA